MEHGGLMPHSQGLSNNPYTEPNQPNYSHWYLSLKVHSNIFLLSKPRPHERSLSYRFTSKNFEGTSTFFHSDYMTRPSQSSRLNHLTILGEPYKLWSSSLWSLLHSPFSPLLGPNIRLRILFSTTLNLHSSLKCKRPCPHTYSTTIAILSFYY